MVRDSGPIPGLRGTPTPTPQSTPLVLTASHILNECVQAYACTYVAYVRYSVLSFLHLNQLFLTFLVPVASKLRVHWNRSS